MCGILGSVNLPFAEDVLDIIAHRGPDSQGLTEAQVGSHHVTLGHRRLAIVDLSESGHQPMYTDDNRFCIIFNGEVYNHDDLRKSLNNVPFHGHSDTETILHLLVKSGVNALKDFNGIFSLAFLDKENQKLILARDPFGVKPLYYMKHGKEVCFSSEIKPLLKLKSGKVSQQNLAELLRLRYLPSPLTLFDGIVKLKPGHYIEIDLTSDLSGEVTQKSFISAVPSTLSISYNEAVEEYGRLFNAAVRRQLMSDVEVGILLSGGVDSALVAKIAQNHLDYQLRSFTVGFSEQDSANELADAAGTASILGIKNESVVIGFDDFIANLNKTINIVEEPLATTSIIPMFFLSHLAADNVKVVLTGQGADEPLGGYGRYQGILLSEYLKPGIVRALKPLLTRSFAKNASIRRGIESLEQADELEKFMFAYEVFDRQSIKRLAGIESTRVNPDIRYYYELLQLQKLKSSTARMMSLDTRMNLADDLLLYTDKITMHDSMECRVPLLDLDLVRFIESLPTSYRVQFRNGKRIHKEYAKQQLPLEIINRKKKGFQSPTKQWFSQTENMKRIFRETDSAYANHLDLDETIRIIDEHGQGYNRERHIFLLLCLLYWFENFQ